MKEINRVFFGEKGITSTSANHLANLDDVKGDITNPLDN